MGAAQQRAELPRPNEASVPSGSYLQSCAGCAVKDGPEGRTLSCSHCSAPGSPPVSSSIVLSTCPQSFSNNNGKLICSPVPNAQDVPKGGYIHSCKGCSIVEQVLMCTHCSAANGDQGPSSLSLEDCPPPQNIDNSNGRLMCSPSPNAADIPPGGYMESCLGCKVQRDSGKSPLLTCTHCRKSDGEQVRSQIEVAQCPPPGHISNHEGSLTCAR